ncbi:Di-copper centre-containing protein [Westerdykella ornata]|uniref:tyrosinase n=1 Tax=Westerdykella ornata TaxID=318751 RepID=A0A6A6JQ96_WESOR|nr:Di-copper centre-containing protein [Westerdykella ornata]KAF2278293.1 Di-copper centre-containing protein [Westerdykella ornata]
MAAFSKPRGLLPMLFAVLVFLQAAAALHAVHGSPEGMRAHMEATKRELEQELQKRQVQTSWLFGNFLAIEGVNGSRSPAARREIRDLRNDSEAWNLYLLGMEKFMKKSPQDKVGYYQIAGVHGRPYVSWNNSPLSNSAGYCPHGNTLFGTWHRPYLAVFEQAWYLAVQEVINEFPESDRQRLRDVARDLRIPYWDWAAPVPSGQPAVPTAIRDQYVTVRKPQGLVSIPNPLYSYTWGSSLPSEMGGGPWGNFATTLRRPVANPTRSNNNEFNSRMQSLRVSLRDRIYGLFAARPVPSFGYVSTSQIGARPAGGNNVDSFESIHDAIHVTAGGESGGHMYYLDYSAFDPLFWLHHTNIDRLLAMYQLTAPNTYVAIGTITHAMAQWNQGTQVHGGTGLRPFTKNANGDYFTSDDVRNTRSLGYFYPETRNGNAADVYNAVSALYGPNSQRSKRSLEYRHGHGHGNGNENGHGHGYGKEEDGYESEPEKPEEEEDHEEQGEQGKEGDYTAIITPVTQYEGRPLLDGEEHYVLNVIANKYALPGSYSIHAFLGNPSSNTTVSLHSKPSSYPIHANTTTTIIPVSNTTTPSDNGNKECEDPTLSPDYIGAYAILGGTHASTSPSLADGGLMTSGALPLTTALQAKQAAGYLPSLCRDDVIPYLTANLYYKVIGPGNVEIPADQIPGLHLGVKGCKVSVKDGQGMPAFGNYEDVPGVLEGKPAGEPYTHVLEEGEKVVVPEGEYVPGKPEGNEGEGECVVRQKIEYVDAQGRFLYEEME